MRYSEDAFHFGLSAQRSFMNNELCFVMVKYAIRKPRRILVNLHTEECVQ